MKKTWFKPVGWIYYPVSAIGWLITIAVLLLCIQFFTAVDRNSHSASDTLISFFPYGSLFVIIWGWVASKTCRTFKNNSLAEKQ